MRPFGDLVGQFSGALDKLNPKQRQTAINTLLGSDASRAATIVLGAGRKRWNSMSASVGKAGSAQQLANAQMKGLNGALQAAQSSLETAGLLFGKALAPSIVRVAGDVGDVANWFSQCRCRFSTTPRMAAPIAAGIGPLLVVLGNAVVKVIELRAWFVALGESLPGVAARLSALSASLSVGPIPGGAVVLALVALAAVLMLAYRHSAEVRRWCLPAFVRCASGGINWSRRPVRLSAW